MSKEIEITCTWRSTHWIEVPDDFVVPSNLSDFPDGALEEMTSDTASLIDWE